MPKRPFPRHISTICLSHTSRGGRIPNRHERSLDLSAHHLPSSRLRKLLLQRKPLISRHPIKHLHHPRCNPQRLRISNIWLVILLLQLDLHTYLHISTIQHRILFHPSLPQATKSKSSQHLITTLLYIPVFPFDYITQRNCCKGDVHRYR